MTDDWRARADCRPRTQAEIDRGHDPDAFFERPDDDPHGPRVNGTEVNTFKARCHSHCLVRTECLNFALSMEGDTDRGNRYGIWGGLTPGERADLSRARRDVA